MHRDPNEIVIHLVGLKDVRVLSYARRGPAGELTIEQVIEAPACPTCGVRAYVKDRPVVSYTDLPFGGVPMTLRWKKHRLVCVNEGCSTRSFTMGDQRIAAKGCMLTTTRRFGIVSAKKGAKVFGQVARGIVLNTINPK